jgi:hypothetical protein
MIIYNRSTQGRLMLPWKGNNKAYVACFNIIHVEKEYSNANVAIFLMNCISSHFYFSPPPVFMKLSMLSITISSLTGKVSSIGISHLSFPFILSIHVG